MEERILRELVVGVVGSERADQVMDALGQHRDLVEALGYNRRDAYEEFRLLCLELARSLAGEKKMKTFAESFPLTPKPHTFGVVTRPSLIWTMNRFLYLIVGLGFKDCKFLGETREIGRTWEGSLEINGVKTRASVGNGWVYLARRNEVGFFPAGKRWKKSGVHSVKKQMLALSKILSVPDPEAPPAPPPQSPSPQKGYPLPEGTKVYNKDGVLIGEIIKSTSKRAVLSLDP